MTARRRLLVIKTSSLGDVVHALPAISDISAFAPDASIDWVCEEAFADIPALHPAVGRVIPCAIRRWRRTWSSATGRAEIGAFGRVLRATNYDAVVDLQGLIKSALISDFARGDAHGYAWKSAREPLASLAYAHRHVVAWGQHAIARNRQLASAALGIAINGGPPRYGLDVDSIRGTGSPATDPYIVALHSTSRADKLWPEENWRRLLARLAGDGVRAVLPWGNDAERARSLRLALGNAGAIIPGQMSPRELSRLFAGAAAVVGVDTGLVHLAAAVGAPAICIFATTDPALTGVIGEHASAINLGGNGAIPGVDDVLDAVLPQVADADAAARGARAP